MLASGTGMPPRTSQGLRDLTEDPTLMPDHREGMRIARADARLCRGPLDALRDDPPTAPSERERVADYLRRVVIPQRDAAAARLDTTARRMVGRTTEEFREAAQILLLERGELTRLRQAADDALALTTEIHSRVVGTDYGGEDPSWIRQELDTHLRAPSVMIHDPATGATRPLSDARDVRCDGFRSPRIHRAQGVAGFVSAQITDADMGLLAIIRSPDPGERARVGPILSIHRHDWDDPLVVLGPTYFWDIGASVPLESRPHALPRRTCWQRLIDPMPWDSDYVAPPEPVPPVLTSAQERRERAIVAG